ncbi:MAG: acylneuraminate cytidylyltransferase family protein [Clostridiaceae bacterium]
MEGAKTFKNKSILAIIPARGGSKGIPRKNIKLFNNKPLISFTIEEAKKSKYINRVIVSTEDREIAEISKNYGAEVPFLRPKELAEDNSPGIDHIIYCIKWLKNNENYLPNFICILQCTSPLRKVKQIDEAIEILLDKDIDTVVSICESEVSPYWMKKLDNNKLKDFLDNIPLYTNRQALPIVYRLNGAIYLCKTELLLKTLSFYNENTVPYIMNRVSSVDIDDLIDFKFAEFLIKEGY